MTIKQDNAITNVVENGGNVSKAMIKAGYTPATAKNPSKLTQSKAYKKRMSSIMKSHDITVEQYMMNVGGAMKANKQNNFTGEVTVDHQVRLSGNKQAERFLFNEPSESKEMGTVQLKELANESDEIKLTELVFKRNS